MFRRPATLLAALSLAASPALAEAPSAQPLSLQPAVRAGAPIQGSSRLEGGNLLPAILFLAIVVGGVLLATGVIDHNHHPHSP